MRGPSPRVERALYAVDGSLFAAPTNAPGVCGQRFGGPLKLYASKTRVWGAFWDPLKTVFIESKLYASKTRVGARFGIR